ncbi:GTPase IMAP family member 9-like [Mytilus galloprovincialis]|uniref:GTPase IMAP family member 9-like n=1 Tax=Mytilus galloprovincialis TaxID=29158 RepID=UPI003F7BF8C7
MAAEMIHKRDDNEENRWKTDLQTIIKNELRVLIIGKSGHGKSETGNTLLGKQVFDSGLSPNPETTRFRFGTKVINNRNIVIVDGPGLFFDSGFTEVNMKKELAKATALLAPGPNVFILIVGLNKFDESEIRAIDMYKNAFGEELMKYLIVVFTRGDELIRNGLLIKDYVNKFEEGPVKTFLADCENRYTSINNIATADIKDKEANRILEMIFALEIQNGGKIYQNAEFIKAEKEVDNRIKEMVNKSTESLTHDAILALRASVRSEIVEEASWFKTMMGTLIVGFGTAIAFYLSGPGAVVGGMALVTRIAKSFPKRL